MSNEDIEFLDWRIRVGHTFQNAQLPTPSKEVLKEWFDSGCSWCDVIDNYDIAANMQNKK